MKSNVIKAKGNEAIILDLEKKAEKAGQPIKMGSLLVLPKGMQITEDQNAQEPVRFSCVAEGTIELNTSKKGDSSYWISHFRFNGERFAVLGKHLLNEGEKVDIIVSMQLDKETNEPIKSASGYYQYNSQVAVLSGNGINADNVLELQSNP